MEKTIIDTLTDLVPYVTTNPFKKIWIDHDEEADVLYINFTYPPQAVEHEEDERGIVMNYNDKGQLVGVTITAASRFMPAHRG